MKIIILMEDTCGSPQCEFEHGLSVYIETAAHKILMDAGAGEKTLSNARKLGVDLTGVDTVILSHGHYDHSGGLSGFREINRDAVIYMQESALADYYHGDRYIGIDKGIGQMPNVRLLSGDYRIDGELSLFTGISAKRLCPRSNIGLTMRVNGVERQDTFVHEQCLVVEGERNMLFSGCAHNGILNILDRYGELYGGMPALVVSGFHMMKKSPYTEEEKEVIRRTAEELRRFVQEGAVFYTGHCTGQEALELMRPIMGSGLVQMHCGMEIMEQTGRQ